MTPRGSAISSQRAFPKLRSGKSKAPLFLLLSALRIG